MGLRAPAGRFDAAIGGSLDTSDGRRAVSSSPGRGPWAAGGSGEMPAAAVAVALGEAGHDRGAVDGSWLAAFCFPVGSVKIYRQMTGLSPNDTQVKYK